MLAKILVSTLQILSSFYLTIILLRFLLQLFRADFYNPISQFVVKATNPIILPLRRFIPSIGSADTSSLVAALLIQLLVFVLIFLALGAESLNPLLLVAWSVLALCSLLVQFYFFAIIAVIILGWVAPGTDNPITALLSQITEPVMSPFRKLLPSVGGLDFSPILVFLVINVLNIVLDHLAVQLGMGPFAGLI